MFKEDNPKDQFVCNQLTAIARLVRHPKKVRDASTPPQDDPWVVVKTLSQQVAVQQTELATLRNAFALQQKTSVELVDQIKSTGEETQAALAAILARLEAGPVVPQVVVPNDKDYPPLPQTGANSKRKTTTTKPGFTIATTTIGQPSKSTNSLTLSKSDSPTNSWLNCTQSGTLVGYPRLIYASGFPYAKPGDLRKAMQGARIRTSAVRAPIADVEMSVSITYLRFILAPILGHQMEHISKIDCRTTKHGAQFCITVPEDRQRNIIQRLKRQSKQTHWRIRQNYRHRRPDQPRPTAPPPPLSRQILAVNVANISNKRPAIRHIVRNTRLWAISETCITSSKFRFTVPGFDVIQHPATGPRRRGITFGIPSCFGGHEHGSAVGTMIPAKVPNFTPECLWIVGSVYVGHSGATTNYSRREAFASIRQSLDRVVPFDNNHPVFIFGDWNTDPQRLQRIVHSWGHGLTVMQFSGSQITRISTVHGRRHSSIDHFVCNAPARALLTSTHVDRQTAVVDHFVIRTKQIWTSCWLNGDCGA
ncbi:hypothetical protein BASA60_007085 [Batrachochytrium salamandrivorans]|nr:hypothetical protein BASA60_007085 [Batrachochytrium salamandrivorans]